jgi:purine-binding chemotaxis protein CheW
MQNEYFVSGRERHILVFRLAGEELALEISYVREVLNMGAIHPLVRGPDFIEGVINVRNYIITVMDLRKKFGMKPAEGKTGMRIIVCKIDKFIVGLIVDHVSEVLPLSKTEIQATPGIVSADLKNNCISAIARYGERIIPILNIEKILTSEEINSLSAVKK